MTFDISKIVCPPERKPRCFWRLVDWWRRVTGRNRYYIGVDSEGGVDYWCKAVCDTKTGVFTIFEIGNDEYTTLS